VGTIQRVFPYFSGYCIRKPAALPNAAGELAWATVYVVEDNRY